MIISFHNKGFTGYLKMMLKRVRTHNCPLISQVYYSMYVKRDRKDQMSVLFSANVVDKITLEVIIKEKEPLRIPYRNIVKRFEPKIKSHGLYKII